VRKEENIFNHMLIFSY